VEVANTFVRSPQARRDGPGFIRSAAPGSVATYARSINATGSIAGFYYDASNVPHGYVRKPDGTITAFDPKGSYATIAENIDSKGVITGFYANQFKNISGFVRSAGGKITSFGPSESEFTYPMSISAKGRIAGYYVAAVGNPEQQGFVRIPRR